MNTTHRTFKKSERANYLAQLDEALAFIKKYTFEGEGDFWEVFGGKTAYMVDLGTHSCGCPHCQEGGKFCKHARNLLFLRSLNMLWPIA